MINQFSIAGWPRALGALAALALAGCSAFADGRDELQGVVELHELQLGFELGGRLKELRVKRGQRVAQGEVLASLDDSLERPQREARAGDLAAAHAQLQLVAAGPRAEEVRALLAQLQGARASEATLRESARRIRQLRAAGAVPPSQLDEVEGQLARATAEREAAEQRLLAARHGSRPEDLRAAAAREKAAAAALAQADQRLERLTLRASEGGVVLDTHAEPGEVLAAGAPFATLGEPRRPYVDLYVPEARVARIRVGARATVRIDGEEVALAGVVEDVGRRAEFTPRFLYSPKERPNLVVRVRVDVDDPHEVLRAGLPVRARIEEAPALPAPEQR